MIRSSVYCRYGLSSGKPAKEEKDSFHFQHDSYVANVTIYIDVHMSEVKYEYE